MITLDLYEFKNICMEMAELGAANYAKMMSPANDSISQRAAYREFGEARVKRWVSSGLVSRMRSGTTKRSKMLYSRAELISAEKTEKLKHLINK